MRRRYSRWIVLGAAVLCFPLFLASGAANPAAARKRTLRVAMPLSGDITAARLPLRIRSARQARRLRRRLPRALVRNRSALPARASVYVAVRFKPRSRRVLEALVAVLRPQPGILVARAANPRVELELRVPRGVRFRRGRKSLQANAFLRPGAPRGLCAARLGHRQRMRARLTAGPPISYPKGSRANPRVILAQSVAAACGRPYDPSFRTAIQGEARPEPPSPSAPAAFAWSYLDSQKLDIVGDVVSDTGFDRLEIRLPATTFPDPHGPATQPRRVVSFQPPARLSTCSPATTRMPDDTLVCTGATVPPGSHERLQLRTYPPPADAMGGLFLLSQGTSSRGPYQISGP